MLYTVGEMAKLLGVPASTLRYYDKEGLLPEIERSGSGMRMFTDRDYDWLHTIICLKQTGMPLKDIRAYISMTQEGNETIAQRLELFERQQQAVQAQMDALQETMDILNYKCWYFETALEAGTTEVPHEMPLSEIPEQFRAVRTKLRRGKLHPGGTEEQK